MSKVSLVPSQQGQTHDQGGKRDPTQQRNEQLGKLVFGLSFFTLVPVAAVLIGGAVGFWLTTTGTIGGTSVTDTSQPYIPRLLALNLGALTTTAGLCAVVICLLLRLREYKNEEVPPALTGPIVVVALGAALAFGALFGW